MKKIYTLFFSCTLAIAVMQAQSNTERYFPGPTHNWETREANQLGLNADSIAAAVQFAIDNESSNHRNLEINHYTSFGREPFGDAVGPHKERGAPTGIILYKGYIIATWGEPDRVDMTFSVSKSFLSSTVGIAFDQGLIRDVHDKVDDYMAPVVILGPSMGANRADQIGQPKVFEPFKSNHNNKITWDHLLRQTSDWEGSLWGKPDWADRPSGEPATWMTRDRKEPGTAFAKC
ncbi:MAG: hypothetical protein AAFO94_03390 [Bacteroidota bacterium]